MTKHHWQIPISFREFWSKKAKTVTKVTGTSHQSIHGFTVLNVECLLMPANEIVGSNVLLVFVCPQGCVYVWQGVGGSGLCVHDGLGACVAVGYA